MNRSFLNYKVDTQNFIRLTQIMLKKRLLGEEMKRWDRGRPVERGQFREVQKKELQEGIN